PMRSLRSAWSAGSGLEASSWSTRFCSFPKLPSGLSTSSGRNPCRSWPTCPSVPPSSGTSRVSSAIRSPTFSRRRSRCFLDPARCSAVTTGGTTQISPCPAVYSNLDGRRPPIETQLYNTLASQLNPYLPAAQAQADAANEIIAAYQLTLLANASASAADIIRQNGMINAINDASEIIGQKANDPASLLLAFGRAQATAQT